jgi:hypothetical protein
MNSSDFDRLDRILDRLHDLERSIPLPHERSIVEVARAALFEAASELAHRLGRNDYWRLGRNAFAARVAS